jgi:hypothetical protein
MSKIYKVFSKKFYLKTFNELKDNDNYYFFEIELVRFHSEKWGYGAKAINTYLLEYVSKDINKPYTEQRYNSTRTIFGTSRFAILLYIYFYYMRNKTNKLWWQM